MEVPCCFGLNRLVQEAVEAFRNKNSVGAEQSAFGGKSDLTWEVNSMEGSNSESCPGIKKFLGSKPEYIQCSNCARGRRDLE